MQGLVIGYAKCPIEEKLDFTARFIPMIDNWAISVCFVKFPEQTMNYLRHSSLDKWTYNKSLQKICESYRVSADNKTIIRTMRQR